MNNLFSFQNCDFNFLLFTIFLEFAQIFPFFPFFPTRMIKLGKFKTKKKCSLGKGV